ncbi:MAG: hypothetical protein K2G04_07095, partial [Oscillospiraceae bacterium]|nr:hypothetical protein [Oscillospiraceae bacterium]
MFDNIRGVISFEAIAPEPEIFVNNLKESPISITNLRCKGNKLAGEAYWSDLENIKQIAEADGVQLSIA